MRLKLTLQTLHKPAFLPFNYQYPLSAAIYKIIQRGDKEFAAFLHNEGYGEGHKQFKLFTFSDIKTTFIKSGDRMLLQGGIAEVIVCFYISRAGEEFIKGLFMHQQLEIADHVSKTVFEVTQVESLTDNLPPDHGSPVLLQPLSAIVTGCKNSRGHYDYRSPQDADFVDCLVYNWIEKYAAAHPEDQTDLSTYEQQLSVAVKLFSYPPQSRLVTIKAGTREQTKIRGYTKFRLLVSAPGQLLDLALGAGLGLNNSIGMGCMEVIII